MSHHDEEEEQNYAILTRMRLKEVVDAYGIEAVPLAMACIDSYYLGDYAYVDTTIDEMCMESATGLSSDMQQRVSLAEYDRLFYIVQAINPIVEEGLMGITNPNIELAFCTDIQCVSDEEVVVRLTEMR